MKKILNGIGAIAMAIGVVTAIGAFAMPARADVAPGFRCAVAKRKAAVKNLHAINVCFADPATPTQGADPACLARADAKLQKDFARIEANGDCQPQTGDEDIVENVVQQCEGALVGTLPGVCLEAGSMCGRGTAPCCAGLRCTIIFGQSTGFCG
jgi:hypothetical protein